MAVSPSIARTWYHDRTKRALSELEQLVNDLEQHIDDRVRDMSGHRLEPKTEPDDPRRGVLRVSVGLLAPHTSEMESLLDEQVRAVVDELRRRYLNAGFSQLDIEAPFRQANLECVLDPDLPPREAPIRPATAKGGN